MARIVLSSCMFRYPMGGMMSWLLQYLVGFARLGHEVWYVERAMRPDDWFDPTRDAMTDDCGYGARVVGGLLARHGYAERWHLVDLAGRRFGASRERIDAAFASADLFVDMGGDGSWLDEAAREYEVAEPGYRSFGEYHYRLGLTYYRLGDRDRAREHLSRAIDVAPGSPSAAQADELLRMMR